MRIRLSSPFLFCAFLATFPSPATAKPVDVLLKNCKQAVIGDAKDLEAALAKPGKPSDASKILFCLGDLYRKQFQKSGDKGFLKKSLLSYEKIARKYAGAEVAPEALLALGDLRRTGLKDETGARAAYFEVIDRYPKSATVAKSRLAATAPKRSENEVPKNPPARTLSPGDEALRPSASSTIRVEQTPTPKRELPRASTPTPAPTPVTATPVPSTREPSTLERVPLTENVLTPTETPTPKPGTGEELVLDESSIPRRPLIVIDPGHGGEDQGAKGVDGIIEKEIVLEISKELEQLLKDRLRAKTFLTRSTDIFIPLADRTKLANDRNADLFVSVHANASEYKTAHGIETYYLDNTSEKSSLKLADRENASLNYGAKQNTDLSFIFSDLIQNMKLDDSISLAHQVQDSLSGTLSRYYQGVNNLGVKKAPFYVLVGAHMPCVLVEVSFIDHPMEGKRLGEKRYQKLIAQSLYEGIKKYFVKRDVR